VPTVTLPTSNLPTSISAVSSAASDQTTNGDNPSSAPAGLRAPLSSTPRDNTAFQSAGAPLQTAGAAARGVAPAVSRAVAEMPGEVEPAATSSALSVIVPETASGGHTELSDVLTLRHELDARDAELAASLERERGLHCKVEALQKELAECRRLEEQRNATALIQG